jgi:N-acetylglucosaminyldiphosphoundecaprenol N-acetyl-beta-D-mannosaminyltransferase
MRHSAFGVELDSIHQTAPIEAVLNWVRVGKAGYVIPATLHQAVKLRSDEALRSASADAAFVVPDGRPLLWMTRLRGIRLQFVTGSDLLLPLCRSAAQAKRLVLFLGATFDALMDCARKIRLPIEGLQIVEIYAPLFGFERDSHERTLAEDLIGQAAPDSLFTALGVPKQEIWVDEHAAKLHVHAICVGPSVDFIAAKQRRAPPTLRRTGFEWLRRALAEPRRLGMRCFSIMCWLPVLVSSDLISARRRPQ